MTWWILLCVLVAAASIIVYVLYKSNEEFKELRQMFDLERELADKKRIEASVGTKEKCKIKVNGQIRTGYRARRPDGEGYYYYDDGGSFLDDALMTIMMVELFSDSYHEEPMTFSDPATLGEAPPAFESAVEDDINRGGGLFDSSYESSYSGGSDYGGGYDGGGFDSGGSDF